MEQVELLKKDSIEFDMQASVNEVNEQIVSSFLTEQSIDYSLSIVIKGRLQLWSKYTKERLKQFEKSLKPRAIFEEKIFNDIRKTKERLASAMAKSEKNDLGAIEDYKYILKAINQMAEEAEMLRYKSAFSFLLKTIQWGILVSLASLTIIFYFLPAVPYIIPIPFGIMISIALIGYGLVRQYPYIKRRDLLIIIELVVIVLCFSIAVNILLSYV